MSTYHFALRYGGQLMHDPEGMELADRAAALHHACEVARELMEHSKLRGPSWILEVYDRSGALLCCLPFVASNQE
jgi:uncharacterized protein DUF6894